MHNYCVIHIFKSESESQVFHDQPRLPPTKRSMNGKNQIQQQKTFIDQRLTMEIVWIKNWIPNSCILQQSNFFCNEDCRAGRNLQRYYLRAILFFRKATLKYGIFHQMRTDHGKKFCLTLDIQEFFQDMRG